MSRDNRSQARLAKLINHYLVWNNLPLQWDVEGVCHGLSLMHVKYVLQNKETEFFEMLDQLACLDEKGNAEISPESRDKMDLFISQVVFFANPQQFDAQYKQDNVFNVMELDGNNLTSNFNLALATSLKNWVQILENDIAMQSQEIFLVSAGPHVITVHRKDDQYWVYDPNYPEGIKAFADAEKLLLELAKIFKQDISKNNLGLSLQSITSSQAQLYTERNAANIFMQYNSQDYYIAGEKRSTLDLLGSMNNFELISYLLQEKKLNLEEITILRDHAIKRNQKDIFLLLHKAIIEQSEPKQQKLQMQLMISETAEAGNLQIFEALMEANDATYYLSFFTSEQNIHYLLRAVATGGQPDIMNHVINTVKQKSHERAALENTQLDKPITRLLLEPLANKTDILMELIDKNAHESFSSLISALVEEETDLPSDRIINYLQKAIENNSFYIVRKLIELLKKNENLSLVQGLELSVTQASKTNLSILQLLQKNEVAFKPRIMAITRKNLRITALFGNG